MGSAPIVEEHAFKHGVSKRDIVHAWRNSYAGRERVGARAFERVLVGPDRRGRDIQLVEVWDACRQSWIVIHAMPLTRSVKAELGLE